MKQLFVFILGIVLSIGIYYQTVPGAVKGIENFVVSKVIPKYPNLIPAPSNYPNTLTEQNGILVPKNKGNQPDNISIFPKVDSWSVNLSDDWWAGNGNTYISFYTNDQSSNVISFYRDKLTKKGWEIGNDAIKESYHRDDYEVFTKIIGDKRFNISVSKEHNSLVYITVSNKKNLR